MPFLFHDPNFRPIKYLKMIDRIIESKRFIKQNIQLFEGENRKKFVEMAKLLNDFHKDKIAYEINYESLVDVIKTANEKGIISEETKKWIIGEIQSSFLANNVKAEHQLLNENKLV